MLEVITRLLILQDRDRRILGLRDELARVGPERQELQARAAASHTDLEAARNQVKQLESERKRLELEVVAKQQLIERYSLQQFQTKKNEEYRALTHEIDTCKAEIAKLEDQELEIMEKAELVQKTVAEKTRQAAATKATVESRVADMNAREKNLEKELADLQANRDDLAAAVDDAVRSRYQRLLRSKGSNVVVGIDKGVCGGCHMTLSRQIVVSCRAEQEIQFCPNCGRILYCSPDMDLAAAE